MKFYQKMREAIYVWWTQPEIANVVAMVRFVGPWKAVKFYAAHRSGRWWSLIWTGLIDFW